MKTSLQVLEWDRLCLLLAQLSETPMGNEQAVRLQPLPSLEKATEMVALVEEGHAALAEEEGGILAGIEDLRGLLQFAHRSGTGLGGQDLYRVQRTLRIEGRVRARFAGSRWPLLSARAQRLPDFLALTEQLGNCVAADGSVPDSAAPQLQEARQRRLELERKVRRKADQLVQRDDFRVALREGPPVLRGGRLMLAVRAEARGMVRGVLHDRSASGSTVFIEPFDLVEPQNELADLHALERRLEARILLECTREVLRHEGEIHESLRILGGLDLVFARVRFGRRMGGRLIRVEAAGPLQLRGAYHPLLLAQALEQCQGNRALAASSVVPFDLTLGEDFDVLVITGPNTGGKTVTLKAVGLLALMALAAIPAPVVQGLVPWIDAVHADIGDEQDLQQSLSTFSGHLRRIAKILDRLTARSLVLLDELGSGTDPAEGEALGRALLLHLLRRHVKAVATTHLSGLKELGFSEERAENASLEFDVDSLRPLFRLTLGLPGESNALRIARRHGIPQAILDVAQQHLFRDGAADLQRSTEMMEKSRRRVLQHLERAEKEAEELQSLRAELDQRERELKSWAEGLERQKEAEIERALREASERGLQLYQGLGTVPAQWARKLEQLVDFLRALPERSSMTQRREEYVRKLKKNDTVYLPRYRESCRVQKVDRARKTVTVTYRAMSLDVPFSEIARPDDYP